MQRILTILAALLLLAGVETVSVPRALAQGASANDTARYLAGMEVAPSSPLAGLAREDAWLRYAPSQDLAWQKLDVGQLGRVRAWAGRNLPNKSPLMLYMFSGPDFLYANAFFPHATTYVLSGLEAVGGVPDVVGLSPQQRADALASLAVPLGQIQQFSYFITKDMNTQLRASKLTGTLPLLYVFLARTGNQIDRVELVRLKSNGQVATRGKAKGGAPGVRIGFRDAGGQARTLYYFRTDLSNGGLAKSGFKKFCSRLGAADVLIKAASYLLHNEGFSAARNFLLTQSATIVQDDSGIPLRYFSSATWWLAPFGAYYGPIPMFAERFQPEMQAMFERNRPVPLDFGIGYRWPPKDSNVLLALKQSGAPPYEGRRDRRRERQERRERRGR